jgi:hypothetical protein
MAVVVDASSTWSTRVAAVVAAAAAPATAWAMKNTVDDAATAAAGQNDAEHANHSKTFHGFRSPFPTRSQQAEARASFSEKIHLARRLGSVRFQTRASSTGIGRTIGAIQQIGRIDRFAKLVLAAWWSVNPKNPG